MNEVIYQIDYLEDEIDNAFKTLKIDSKKLEVAELTDLIKSLTKKFFKSQSNVLDAINLNEKKQSTTLTSGGR